MLIEDEDLCFGHFRLDTRRRELRAGTKPVALQSRPLDILEYLIRHRDRAVSRDDILQHVYRDRTVSPGNVAVQIAAIRTALTRAGGDPKLIVTTGSAYRFTGEILSPDPIAATRPPPPEVTLPPDPPPAPPARPRRRAWLMGLTALPLATAAVAAVILLWPHRQAAARLSFAVLPFRNITGDATQDFRAEGITDELNADLAYIPAATVIARESAVAYQERHAPIPEIGRALHVHYIVTGDLGLEDNVWRLHPRLIDTDTGTEVWSASLKFPKSIEGELTPTLAAAIASALNTTIDRLESARAQHDSSDNPDAIDLFYQARALLDADDAEQSFSQAIPLLESAIAQQPDFVAAQVQLAWLLLRKQQSEQEADSAADRKRAHDAIAHSLALAPGNASALAARSLELELNQQCPEAEHVARHALEITSSNLQAWHVLHNCAWDLGHLNEASVDIAAIRQLDPGHVTRLMMMQAHIDLLQGHPAVAIDLLRRVLLDLPEPKQAGPAFQPPEYARLLLIAAYQMNNQAADAKDLYQSYSAAYPNRSIWRVIYAIASRARAFLPGTRLVAQALEAAGMPSVASETTPGAADCVPDRSDFDPTPTGLPGGSTISTAELISAFKHRVPLVVIDVGQGVAAYPGAAWNDRGITTGDMAEFADSAARAGLQGPMTEHVVVAGDGPFGCGSYLTARHLVEAGWKHVDWYRGGEEAWSHSGQPADDHRLY